MRFIVVTGLSGAGKSQAVNFLEDIGYFCIDNLPPVLISKFAEMCFTSKSEIDKIALVMDVRGLSFFDDFFESLEYLKKNNYKYEVLFLEAKDEVLIKRFKETRRRHPLARNERIINGIKIERVKLREIKNKADVIIDTSNLTLGELDSKIRKYFGDFDEKEDNKIYINVLSFGFKNGVPTDADLIFDVRFMKNPFYVEKLKKLSGNDKLVYDFVHSNETTIEFMKKLEDMLLFLIPNYIIEGKKQLVIAIGCTGGRHRSVAIVNRTHEILKLKGYNSESEHRDLNKDLM